MRIASIYDWGPMLFCDFAVRLLRPFTLSSFRTLQEKLEDLKQELQLQRRRRLYEAYLWEGRPHSWGDDSTSTQAHMKLVHEIDRMRDEYEGRVFEDPLYLMQYTIVWEDTNVGGASLQSPENDAFINAENEVYLRKVHSC